MKGFLVFFLAIVFVSVSKAEHKSIFDIHRAWNISNTRPSRIIRGIDANVGDFPYHVRLTMELPPAITGSCGGSIIAPNWVLTAAHCLSVDVIAVFLGLAVAPPLPFVSFTIEAGSVVAGQAAQTRSLFFNDAHAHPEYDYSTLVNDIGLLNNQEPFDIATSSNVRHIALVAFNPNAGTDIYVNQVVTATGFGYTTNDGPVSPVLKYTKDLRGISFARCQSRYSGSTLPPTSFCIQDPTTPYSAICSGDSGGPITLLIGGVLRQIGIISYGSSAGCDTAGQGMTNVALFVDWIKEKTGIP